MSFLIDPINITNFHRTTEELELFALFWITAAGKNALSSARALDRFLQAIHCRKSPFQAIRKVGKQRLPSLMKKSGIGCYKNKAKSFWSLAHSGLNLKTCSIEDLETIYGVGRKTSRCYVMHSRKDARCAGLDTHLLKFLRDKGYTVPKTTPSSDKLYKELEDVVLAFADKAKMPPAEFDLKIWRQYSGNDRN